ncbi:hypothetical protein [Ferruginibacter sp. SUN106]|uniref:hypothetical protein n=1 Tax=Ferruginibacter sp. SUN106 TaxID=2978348 RepID=UPI003D367F7C
MKVFFLILTTLCITAFVHAQKDFRGEIIYKLHASGDEKTDAELKVLFGERKIKLFFKEGQEYEQNALLVLLDSGAVYTLSAADKMFKKKLLITNLPLPAPQKKTISGYTTTPFQPEKNGLSGLYTRLLGSSNATFYLADSLTYFIPEKYRGNMELVNIQQGRIVLGAELQMTNPPSEEEFNSGTTSNQVITVEAVSIKPMPIDENEFIIPADYTDRKNISFEPPVIVDTTAAMVDSAVKVMRTTKKRMPASKGKAKTKATIKPKVASKKE